MTDQKLEVVHFQRRQRPEGNFSLEFIFEDVRELLQDEVNFKVARAPYYSNGLWKRLQNALWARKEQGQVNHITGDVHYLNLFFDSSKCILTVLDCGIMATANPLSKLFYQLFWFSLPERKSKFITAISESTKRDFIRYTGCVPEKVHVVPVAVSELFKPVPRVFNFSCPVLLQIGTSPNKNIDRLAEAIQGLSCKLVIVGRISDETKSKLQTCGVEFENKINLTAEDLYQEYVDCDIVTFVSTFEGFGMPIVEGNCVERVVITGNTTSMPEVAGNAACIVDPFSVEDIRQGIIKIITDQPYRDGLIANGRLNRMRFKRETIANLYLDLYRKIASAERSGQRIGSSVSSGGLL